MANDTVTIQVAGAITLADFQKATTRFHSLVDALTSEIADKTTPIVWTLDDLHASSAVLTSRGEVEDERNLTIVERIVVAYDEVGESLESGRLVPFSPRVVRAADQLRQLLNGRVEAIVLETSLSTHLVSERPEVESVGSITEWGAVEGYVETLTRHRRLRFTLYDLVWKRAVSCYLSEGDEDIMRTAWSNLAIVSGLVSRDPVTGRPLSIRQVSSVEILPEVSPGAYLDARGAHRVPKGTPKAEDRIRRLRDAQ